MISSFVAWFRLHVIDWPEHGRCQECGRQVILASGLREALDKLGRMEVRACSYCGSIFLVDFTGLFEPILMAISILAEMETKQDAR